MSDTQMLTTLSTSTVHELQAIFQRLGLSEEDVKLKFQELTNNVARLYLDAVREAQEAKVALEADIERDSHEIRKICKQIESDEALTQVNFERAAPLLLPTAYFGLCFHLSTCLRLSR
jgi:uncharacterized protein Yka (UPF0111/DUF47 family)